MKHIITIFFYKFDHSNLLYKLQINYYNKIKECPCNNVNITFGNISNHNIRKLIIIIQKIYEVHLIDLLII